MVEIREIKSLRDLKGFVLFPFKLYRGNKYWIPPLISDEINNLRWDKNPAFEFCDVKYWLACKDGRIAGRIAGIINNRYIEKWKNKFARFGWVDFYDDEEVSQALFGAVENWAKSKGLEGVHGPLGFTDFDPEGMLVEGFDELGTMPDIYNHRYYKDHVEKRGYLKDVDWVEYEIFTPERVPERAERVASLILKKNRLRVLDAKRPEDLLPYAQGVFDVIDEAYRNLYGFVPLNEKQVEFYIKLYFPHIVPDYVKIVLDEKDEVAGFVLGVPSLSRALQKARGRLFPLGFIYLLRALRKNRYLDLYLGAVRPDLQGRGVDALLMTELTRTCIKKGIISAESTKELEENWLVQAHWKHYKARRHKRRRCYIKNPL